MVFAIELGVAMILSIPITYIIIHVHATSDNRALFGDKLQSNEDDNPLLLTIQAMERELDELRQNNAYMKHIQNLEKQIKEAKANAEALSKLSGEYGNTMEEVGEAMCQTVSKCRIPNDKKNIESKPSLKDEEKMQAPILNKIDESSSAEEVLDVFDKELTRQNTAIYRTYTRQAGWSSYYDVEFK